MNAGIDYSKTFLQNRKTEDLIKHGEDYLLYPLGTKLYRTWYNGKRVKIYEIYGIEICGAGIFYNCIELTKSDIQTLKIPEDQIGNGKMFELERED